MFGGNIEGDPYIHRWIEIRDYEKISKLVHENIINKEPRLDIGAQVLWRLDLNVELEDPEWKKVLYVPIQTTLCTKLRYFEYKVLQRILVTNILRYKWGKVDTPNCTFCQANPENITHLLWECQIVSRFWQEFRLWIFETFNVSINLNKTKIILNTFKGPNEWLINAVVLMAKQYICSKKCLQEELSLIHFAEKVTQIPKS